MQSGHGGPPKQAAFQPGNRIETSYFMMPNRSHITERFTLSCHVYPWEALWNSCVYMSIQSDLPGGGKHLILTTKWG